MSSLFVEGSKGIEGGGGGYQVTFATLFSYLTLVLLQFFIVYNFWKINLRTKLNLISRYYELLKKSRH